MERHPTTVKNENFATLANREKLHASAEDSLQTRLAESGAVEAAEKVVFLKGLLEQYKNETVLEAEAYYLTEAAAKLLSELEKSPAQVYFDTITPENVEVANDRSYQLAA